MLKLTLYIEPHSAGGHENDARTSTDVAGLLKTVMQSLGPLREEPAPATPAPAAEPAPAPPAYSESDQAWMLGKQAFESLVIQWSQNWGSETAPQVDRGGLLMGAATNHLAKIKMFVTEKGGLATATADVLLRLGYLDGVNKLAKDIAYRLVQVGSALGFGDFERMLEASLVMTREEIDDSPIVPGVSAHVIRDLPEDRPWIIGGVGRG